MPAKYSEARIAELLVERVREDENGCKVWIGGKTAAGYGRIGEHYAHRIAYELTNGPIPQSLQIDHLCRNRACVEVAHLEPVPQVENIRRGDGGKHWAAKTECPRGHAYDDENTYHDSKGRRHCRACRMVYQRAFRAKR